jgi:hypothetical protein
MTARPADTRPSEAEFRRVVRRGLGRAVLYLRQHDPAPYRAAIRDLALHWQGYDRQIEGSRAAYLTELIDCSDAPHVIHDEVIAAITSAEDDDDGLHLLELGVLLARRGDDRARHAMYQRYQELINHIIAGGFRIERTSDGRTMCIQLSTVDPCAFCRESLVNILIELDAMPDWMLQECQWDSNPEIRAAVRGMVDSGEANAH